MAPLFHSEHTLYEVIQVNGAFPLNRIKQSVGHCSPKMVGTVKNDRLISSINSAAKWRDLQDDRA